MNLLTTHNTKTRKGQSAGYDTYILHLAPARLSGFQVCPLASRGCKSGCLNTAGHGIYPNIQNARIRKTQLFFKQRDAFFHLLVEDIHTAIRRSRRNGQIPVFRLNGTSDIRWELYPVQGHASIFAMFPAVQFYDYTKIPNRRNLPSNYHLTFSRSEVNNGHVHTAMKNGLNIAVVFAGPFPQYYLDRRVVSGDDHDLRFLDPCNVVIGLSAKGRAKKDTSGFVVRI